MQSPTEVYSDEGLYVVREVFSFCSQNLAFELYIRGENVVGRSIDFASMHAHSLLCSYIGVLHVCIATVTVSQPGWKAMHYIHISTMSCLYKNVHAECSRCAYIKYLTNEHTTINTVPLSRNILIIC